MLRAVNPRIPPNQVYYDYKTRSYCPFINVDHIVYHFQQFSRLEFNFPDISERRSTDVTPTLLEDEPQSAAVIEEIDLQSISEAQCDDVFEEELPANLARVKFDNQDRICRIAIGSEGQSDEKDGLNSQRRHAIDFSSPATMVVGKKTRKFSNDMEEEPDADDFDIFDLDVADIKEPLKKVTKLIDKSKVFERGTQTPHFDSRDKGDFTESPVSDVFSVSVDQAMIYDKYIEEVIRNEQFLKKGIVHTTHRLTHFNVLTQSNLQKLKPIQYGSENLEILRTPLMILERMIYHNNGVDLLLDLSDWDDPADELRKSQYGTLLPLWKVNCGALSKRYLNLQNEATKALSLTITDMKWCSGYPDLLILSIGHYQFSVETLMGFVCGFSWKNLEVPEFVIATNSGAMCLDVSNERPSLVCVGFYDGSVAVYDVSKSKSRNRGLVGRSTCVQEHHIDMITCIKWINAAPVNLLQSQSLIPQNIDPVFVTTGEDGKVILWRINKSGVGQMHFLPTEIASWMENFISISVSGKDDVSHVQSEFVSSFDIHNDGQNYIIGTKLGHIQQSKLSTWLSNERLSSNSVVYGRKGCAHAGMVSSLMWNPYHPLVFLSASLDWTVKIWDVHKPGQSVIELDLESDVTDAKWSYHSGTVLAAVTTELKVFVFDLQICRDSALCSQRIISSKRISSVFLTKVLFNGAYTTVTIADNRGTIVIFKMSPNLRRKPKERKGIEISKGPHVEREHLQNVIEYS